MRANDRVCCLRIHLAAIVDASIRVSAAIDMLRFMARGQARQHLLHRRREGIVGRVHVRKQRIAADLREHVYLKDRAKRRFLVAGHVRVPEFAVRYLRFPVSMNHEHFGVPWHLRRCRMYVQFAKHPADLHLRRWRDLCLILEEQHPEAEERRANVPAGLLVQTAGQIDASNLGAECRRKGLDLESLTRCALWHVNVPATKRGLSLAQRDCPSPYSGRVDVV